MKHRTETDGAAPHRTLRSGMLAQQIIAGDQAVAEALSNAATVVSYDAGDDLLCEGDETDHLIFVLSGGVDIVIGGNVVASIPAPCLVGEMALFQASPTRSATVRANTLTACAELPAAAFKRVAKEHPAVLRRMIDVIRARDPNTKITAAFLN